MGIKAVTRWETDDGQVHATQQAALKHDAQRKSMEEVRTALQTICSSSAPSMIAIEVVNNPKNAEMLRDACNRVLAYHRNYGKLKKK